MKGILNLLALASLLSASGFSQAAIPSPDQDALARDILANLEFNTFPNSLRPMHFPDGTTLGQTPHHIVEKVQAEQTTWRAVDDERSWMYAVTIIKSGPEGVTICFRDRSFVGSYRATAPLVVKRNANGHYLVVEELSDLPGCPQTKG